MPIKVALQVTFGGPSLFVSLQEFLVTLYITPFQPFNREFLIPAHSLCNDFSIVNYYGSSFLQRICAQVWQGRLLLLCSLLYAET